MPNHTRNIVDISVNSGDTKEIFALAELKAKLDIAKGNFDFNSLIPMPKPLTEALDRERVCDHPDWENVDGCYVPKSKLKRQRWLKLYGATNWYDWRRINWGTKWNSYDVEIDANFDDELSVQFYTAWSAPLPVFFEIQKYCKEHGLGLYWEVSFEEDSYDHIYELTEEDLTEWAS
jgi:hypothetical protein